MKSTLFVLFLALLLTQCRNAAPGTTPAGIPADSLAATASPATTATLATATTAADTSQLIKVMLKSAEDWNKGDLAGFMDSYDDSATMMTRHGLIGKDSMMFHYRQTYFKAGAARQRLVFDQLQIKGLVQNYVLLTGRFTLSGNNLPPQSGRFSLVCVYGKKGWKILHDHTS